MPVMEEFIAALGTEVQDVDDETYDLFSENAALPDLGMIDPKADTVDISIADKTYTILQSPGLLQSQNRQGTTGAALWQTAVRVAEWSANSKNGLFQHGVLDGSSTALELGSGISGLVANVLASRVRCVVATDQQHLLKHLRMNIEEVAASTAVKTNRKSHQQIGSKSRQQAGELRVLALDWEEDDAQKQLTSHGFSDGFDLVLACDCIFNYALIPPFVQTCADICRLRKDSSKTNGELSKPSICVVAQQLRQAEVFEEWLKTFMQHFKIWRLPSEMLTDGLKEGSGFAVHVGVLHEEE